MAYAAANGAPSPGARLVIEATPLMKIERSAFAVATFVSSSRSLRTGSRSARTLRAKACPPAAALSTTPAIRPLFSASSDHPHYHLYGKLWPNCAGEALRSATGQKAQFDLGQAEFGGVGRARKWQAIATSNPRPRAWPWMAATMGLGESSMTLINSSHVRGFDGLPNSVISVPGINVRAAQVRTIAFTSGLEIASFMHSKIPPRTAAPSAFTGG